MQKKRGISSSPRIRRIRSERFCDVASVMLLINRKFSVPIKTSFMAIQEGSVLSRSESSLAFSAVFAPEVTERLPSPLGRGDGGPSSPQMAPRQCTCSLQAEVPLLFTPARPFSPPAGDLRPSVIFPLSLARRPAPHPEPAPRPFSQTSSFVSIATN